MTPEQKAALQAWQDAKDALIGVAKLVEAERTARKHVADVFFPAPIEGTNTTELGDGWLLKYVYKLDRKLDEAAYPAVRQALSEQGVGVDNLVRWQPVLNVSDYRQLHIANPEAAKIFDTVVTTKPGSHTLSVLSPKDNA